MIDIYSSVAKRLTRDILLEWQRVRINKDHAAAALGTVADQNNNNNMAQWMRTGAGKIKCNVDATIFTKQRQYGIGACLRNEHGEFVAQRHIGTKDHRNLVIVMQKLGAYKE
ncbi:hypothetical protein A2U01_0030229, partial [Trifolium medium]|nr:hypothetical protein [Trifolium medium]